MLFSMTSSKLMSALRFKRKCDCMGMDHSYIWWTNVTGPQMFIKSVVSSLSDNYNVRLPLPKLCPWPNRMRELIAEAAQSEYALEGVTIDVVTPDDFKNVQSPVEALLDRYALNDVRLRYRNSLNPAEYLIQNHVLKDRIVWLTGFEPKDIKTWMGLICGWPSTTPLDGLFVVETSFDGWSSLDQNENDGCKTISYRDSIGEYSVSLFNGLLVDEMPSMAFSGLEKRYCASLLSNVCGGDVEVSDILSENLDLMLDNSYYALCSVLDYFDNDRVKADHNNVLAIALRADKGAIDRRVWKAQVEILFPILEARRLAVIARVRDQLAAVLESSDVSQFGERVSEPENVELGTLVYLMAQTNDDGERLLYIPDRELRDEIHLLHECRNTIAHHKVCEWSQVKRLLESGEDSAS